MSDVKPIPFRIDRNLMVNFADQMAEGFRAAIRRGYYRAGDLLPKQDEIAKELGVSIRIPREAYRILEDASLVRPRRGVGCEVTGRREGVWKGRILFVYQSESEGSYAPSVFNGSVRRGLMDAGYLVMFSGIDHAPSGRPDFTVLTSLLNAQYDLIAVFYPREKCEKVLALSKSPVVYVGDLCGECSPSERYGEAMDDLIGQCRAERVKHVLLAGYWPFPAIQDRFAHEPGFRVETMLLKGNPGPNYLERLMERSLKTFLRRLSVRSELPDLLFCFDDYVARGALAAIAHLGIRMPVDMKFATLVNKGNAPVSAIGLARLVNDPRAIGQWTADALLSRIDKRSVPPLPRVSFENGESFSLKCGVRKCKLRIGVAS